MYEREEAYEELCKERDNLIKNGLWELICKARFYQLTKMSHTSWNYPDHSDGMICVTDFFNLTRLENEIKEGINNVDTTLDLTELSEALDRISGRPFSELLQTRLNG